MGFSPEDVFVLKWMWKVQEVLFGPVLHRTAVLLHKCFLSFRLSRASGLTEFGFMTDTLQTAILDMQAAARRF